MWRGGCLDEKVGPSSVYLVHSLPGRAGSPAHNTDGHMKQGCTLTKMVILSLLSAPPHPSDMITHSSVRVAPLGTNSSGGGRIVSSGGGGWGWWWWSCQNFFELEKIPEVILT